MGRSAYGPRFARPAAFERRMPLVAPPPAPKLSTLSDVLNRPAVRPQLGQGDHEPLEGVRVVDRDHATPESRLGRPGRHDWAEAGLDTTRE